MNTTIMVLLGSLAVGEYRVERVPPQRQSFKQYVVVRVPTTNPTYDEAVARAVAQGEALVIGLRCDPPKPSGSLNWHTVRVESLDGFDEPGIILSVPSRLVGLDGGWMHWVGTLLSGSSAAQVNGAYQRWMDTRPREEVRPVPRPFSVERLQSSGSQYSVDREPATADADATATGPWRWTDADVPEYMERYAPAKYTQEIAVTNGRDRISRVDRRRLKEKWRVPGGLLGINGWTSELWQWAPRRVWVGNIPVWNGSNFQNNRGYKVEYEPGTEFLDVLRNTESGEVFEVRKAMKTDKGWQRFVTYRNAAERPRGYHGPKGLNCHSCHDEAGTGSYGTGLVPGGDTVLSFPFEALE